MNVSIQPSTVYYNANCVTKTKNWIFLFEPSEIIYTSCLVPWFIPDLSLQVSGSEGVHIAPLVWMNTQVAPPPLTNTRHLAWSFLQHESMHRCGIEKKYIPMLVRIWSTPFCCFFSAGHNFLSLVVNHVIQSQFHQTVVLGWGPGNCLEQCMTNDAHVLKS